MWIKFRNQRFQYTGICENVKQVVKFRVYVRIVNYNYNLTGLAEILPVFPYNQTKYLKYNGICGK